MTDTTPYPVRAWYLCSDGHTGLRTVYVHPNTENNSVNIVVNRAIFPVDADISNMQVAVDGGFYHVFFDRERHQRDRLNGTYLFVRLLNRGQAIDLWPEEVMMDLIKVLDEYVLLLHSSYSHQLTAGWTSAILRTLTNLLTERIQISTLVAISVKDSLCAIRRVDCNQCALV